MATAQGTIGSTEAAIIARIVHTEKDDLAQRHRQGLLTVGAWTRAIWTGCMNWSSRIRMTPLRR